MVLSPRQRALTPTRPRQSEFVLAANLHPAGCQSTAQAAEMPTVSVAYPSRQQSVPEMSIPSGIRGVSPARPRQSDSVPSGNPLSHGTCVASTVLAKASNDVLPGNNSCRVVTTNQCLGSAAVPPGSGSAAMPPGAAAISNNSLQQNASTATVLRSVATSSVAGSFSPPLITMTSPRSSIVGRRNGQTGIEEQSVKIADRGPHKSTSRASTSQLFTPRTSTRQSTAIASGSPPLFTPRTSISRVTATVQSTKVLYPSGAKDQASCEELPPSTAPKSSGRTSVQRRRFAV